jgi:hypothetical protein
MSGSKIKSVLVCHYCRKKGYIGVLNYIFYGLSGHQIEAPKMSGVWHRSYHWQKKVYWFLFSIFGWFCSSLRGKYDRAVIKAIP